MKQQTWRAVEGKNVIEVSRMHTIQEITGKSQGVEFCPGSNGKFVRRGG